MSWAVIWRYVLNVTGGTEWGGGAGAALLGVDVLCRRGRTPLFCFVCVDAMGVCGLGVRLWGWSGILRGS